MPVWVQGPGGKAAAALVQKAPLTARPQASRRSAALLHLVGVRVGDPAQTPPLALPASQSPVESSGPRLFIVSLLLHVPAAAASTRPRRKEAAPALVPVLACEGGGAGLQGADTEAVAKGSLNPIRRRPRQVQATGTRGLGVLPAQREASRSPSGATAGREHRGWGSEWQRAGRRVLDAAGRRGGWEGRITRVRAAAAGPRPLPGCPHTHRLALPGGARHWA